MLARIAHRGEMQGRAPSLCRRRHFGRMAEQQLDAARVAIRGRTHEGRAPWADRQAAWLVQMGAARACEQLLQLSRVAA